MADPPSDRPVGGVMVYAKTPQAKKPEHPDSDPADGKRYYAVLTGVLAKKRRELADTLLKDGRTNMSKIVPKGTAGGKEARLKYEVPSEQNSRMADSFPWWTFSL